MIDEYNLWSSRARYELPSSSLKGKVITTITCYIKGKKWVWNKTFDKWCDTLNDPLQPDKMAKDTMWITKHKNVINMRYKKPMIVNSLTGKLEEYRYRTEQTLDRIDGS